LMMLPLARSILAAMRQQHNIYKIEGGVILENQISCLDKRGHYTNLYISRAEPQNFDYLSSVFYMTSKYKNRTFTSTFIDVNVLFCLT